MGADADDGFGQSGALGVFAVLLARQFAGGVEDCHAVLVLGLFESFAGCFESFGGGAVAHGF